MVLLGEENPILTGAVVTIALALGSGIGYLLNWFSQRRRTSIGEWQEIVTRQDSHIETLQKSQDECRRREGHLCQIIVYLHGIAVSHQEALKKCGQETPIIISINELLGDLAALDFESKTNTQNTELLHAEVQKLKKSDPLLNIGKKP